LGTKIGKKKMPLLRRCEQLRDMHLEQTNFLRIGAVVVAPNAQLLVNQNKIIGMDEITAGIA
jgi:hypothetical protein